MEFAWEAIWSQTFICSEFFFFFLKYTVSFLMINLFKWSFFFFDSVLVSCMFLERCPFLFSSQICWYKIVQSILLEFFLFLQYLLRLLLFHFLFCLFHFSLSSSWLFWPEVCWFCLPFESTSSWFYWFFSTVLKSLLYFSSDLY